MKKIIATLVSLVMLFSVPAFGEEIDLSSMSLDELTDLYMAFIREFQSRVEEQYAGSMIFEGEYITGVDIKPGRYQFICIAEDIYKSLALMKPLNEEGTEWGYLKVFDVGIKYSLPVYFTLEDGVRLDVTHCFGVLIPSDLSSKPIWAVDEIEEPKETPASRATPAPSKEPTEEPEKFSSGVTPSFKTLMDEYETFFDYYIEFIDSMNAGNLELSEIEKYTEMMTQYVETLESLGAIDEDTLSEADGLYYTEVSLRIMKKLSEID